MTRASDLGLCPTKNPADWELYYAQVAAQEEMPWYCAGLDPDVASALERLAIRGGAFLDIGTGPANHALELARRGFHVTGTDLSPSAAARAAERALALGLDARFLADDILASALTGPFDVALDRGCFHCLFAEAREVYAASVTRLLAPGGVLLLKTFSHEDTGTEGPYRFRPEELDLVFASRLERLELVRTIYQGTLEDMPKALFTIWRKPA